MTEVENSLKIPEEGFARVGLDEPVVEVAPHADPHRMENGGNRSHDPGEEDLWSRGEAKAEL